MKRKVLILMLAALSTGCSFYRVSHHEDYAKDGTMTGSTTGISKLVPPGGKDLSEGSLDLSVDKEGAWKMGLGEHSQTDLTGTAALLQGLVNTLVTKSAEAGQLQQQNQMLSQALQQMQAQMQQMQTELQGIKTTKKKE